MRTRLFSLVIFTSLAIALLHCKKSEPDPATPGGTTPPGSNTSVTGAATIPVVKTAPAITGIASTSAQVSVVLGSNGGEAITQHGYTYAETGKESKQVSLGATSGPFPLTVTAKLTNLLPNTAYTVYFFAVNKVGQISMKVDFKTEAPTSTTVSTGGVVSKANFPGQSRRLSRVFTLNGKLYVLGGTDETKSPKVELNDLWEYDPAQDKWSQKAALPVTNGFNVSYTLPVMSIGGKAYTMLTLLGGANITTSTMYVYDPAADKWTPKGSVPFIGNWRTTMVLNGKGYVVGGGYSKTGSNTATLIEPGKAVYEYDPTTDKWTKKKDFPGEPRFGAFGAVYNGKGYIMGGSTENFGSFKDLWEYDAVADVWTQKTASPVDIQGGAYSGKAYLVGGKLTFVQQADKYFTYDFAAQAWTTAQAPDAIYRAPAGGAGCTTYQFQVESVGNSAYLFHEYRSVSGTPCTNLMGQFWQYTP
ncbi:hypothetical protein [Larkinella punicea]|uniref:Fibronectin type-III domain-containing protein n=1 Tax=Larkinella punicea TaxID=2315727 RepID=A0A368JF05_9BACT|nr:hypothetical protein [Larkinella punicea]RCR66227.1 hypothetical protein DUE52_28150 [Larkinella punicea]